MMTILLVMVCLFEGKKEYQNDLIGLDDLLLALHVPVISTICDGNAK